ncbi:hypothetical protein DBR32_09235 [Taibaiella sp. KBW10]|uniref:hypothetical protein n=1 Tax=Taibaiella sp. KBW10 TaxID=2153357 RepID=UPI000F5B6553|nr:hypothetical protein [Taibaiella sp. KBW10]RQO30887.1 hypothetical protein DBR32_09235 [Taibaiella sp. KBW10]
MVSPIKKINKFDFLLLIAIVLEILFSVYAKKFFDQPVNAFGFFFSSLLFGVILLLKFYNKDAVLSVRIKEAKRKNWLSLIMVLLSLIAIAFISRSNIALFLRVPVGPETSDVIPTVAELCQRYLKGSFVYEPIEKFGYHLPVTYLPMQWMPYLIAEKGGFDYRWIAIGIWIIAAVVLLIRSFRSQNVMVRFFAPVLLVMSYFYICYYNDSIVANVIEMMVSGYYILLIVSLNTKNAVFRGLIIGICLLSRYSLLLWLPLAILVIFLSENRKHFWTTALTVFLFICILYVIPFLSKDWSIFYKGYKHYDISALGEWKHLNIYTNKPFHLYSGHGIAFWFYERKGFPIEMRLKYLQKAHLFLCLGATAIMGIWYWFKRTKINDKIFLMGSFKIYLAIFLFFIQVPYLYLMIVGLFVSIAIFFEQGRYLIIRKADS